MRRLEEKREEKRARRRQQEEAKRKAEPESLVQDVMPPRNGRDARAEEDAPAQEESPAEDVERRPLERTVEHTDVGVPAGPVAECAQKQQARAERPTAPPLADGSQQKSDRLSPESVVSTHADASQPGQLDEVSEAQGDRAEEQGRAGEQHEAVLAVRTAIRDLSNANFESFEHMRAQFHRVLQANLDSCGAQRQMLQDEAAAVLAQTTSNFNQIIEQKRKFEMMQAAQQMFVRAAPTPDMMAVDPATRRLRELGGLVAGAEAAAAGARELAARLTACQSPPDLMVLIQRVEAAAADVDHKIQISRDFLECRRAELERGKGPQPLLALRQELAMMAQRVQEASQAARAALAAAQMAKGSLCGLAPPPRSIWAGDLLPDTWSHG